MGTENVLCTFVYCGKGMETSPDEADIWLRSGMSRHMVLETFEISVTFGAPRNRTRMSGLHNMSSHVIDEGEEVLERISTTTTCFPMTNIRWILCGMSGTGMIIKFKQSVEGFVAIFPFAFVLSEKYKFTQIPRDTLKRKPSFTKSYSKSRS